MKAMRATNLRRELYETLETMKRERKPIEVVLGGESVARLVPSPVSKPTKRKPLIDLDAVSSFCKKHRAKSFALFGSILRDDFDELSDVDVLLDLDRFIDFHEECRLVEDLETMFGRKVDLVEKRLLPNMRPELREEIVATAKVLYDAVA